MVAIKLYNAETGHLEILAEVATAEAASTWLERFRAGGAGTSDVVYATPARPPVPPGPACAPDPGVTRTGCLVAAA